MAHTYEPRVCGKALENRAQELPVFCRYWVSQDMPY
jgi:hypothetical protein